MHIPFAFFDWKTYKNLINYAVIAKAFAQENCFRIGNTLFYYPLKNFYNDLPWSSQ